MNKQHCSHMTLIEILIAMFILAIGLMGILATLNVTVQNVKIAENQTTGPNVARQAIVSLRSGYIDLVKDVGNAISTRPNTWNPTITTSSGDIPLYTLANWPNAIYEYSGTHKGDGTDTYKQTFQLPWDLSDPTLDGEGDGNTIPTSGVSRFSWTATFMPLEEPPVNIRTSYRVQITLWRKYDLIYDHEFQPAVLAFTDLPTGQTHIALGQSAAGSNSEEEFAANVMVGDFIRIDEVGLWYHISEIEDIADGSVGVIVKGIYTHPRRNDVHSTVSIASKSRLIGLYETVITPKR